MIAYQVIWTLLFFFQAMVYCAKSTGFVLFLPGVVVETKNRSECISQKMKIAKFRLEHMNMMHVLQMLFISLEEIYDWYVTQDTK